MRFRRQTVSDSHCQSHLIEAVENQERRAMRDFFDGDYGLLSDDLGPPDLTPCRAESAIPSSAKVVAYDLLNAESRTVGESKLFALVDVVACMLAHEGREETARLALESVVESAVALAAVRTLAADVR